MGDKSTTTNLPKSDHHLYSYECNKLKLLQFKASSFLHYEASSIEKARKNLFAFDWLSQNQTGNNNIHQCVTRRTAASSKGTMATIVSKVMITNINKRFCGIAGFFKKNLFEYSGWLWVDCFQGHHFHGSWEAIWHVVVQFQVAVFC